MAKISRVPATALSIPETAINQGMVLACKIPLESFHAKKCVRLVGFEPANTNLEWAHVPLLKVIGWLCLNPVRGKKLFERWSYFWFFEREHAVYLEEEQIRCNETQKTRTSTVPNESSKEKTYYSPCAFCIYMAPWIDAWLFHWYFLGIGAAFVGFWKIKPVLR